MLICINLSIEYSFHMILVTSFLFGEHEFSWLVNKRAIYYDKQLANNQPNFKDLSVWSLLNYFSIILIQFVLKYLQIAGPYTKSLAHAIENLYMFCPRKLRNTIYGTDLMQHHVYMQVRVVLLVSACDSARECKEFHSRVRVLLLASTSAATCERE